VAVGVGISVVAITNALLLAKRPNFRGSAPILPPAGVLAADMLRYDSLRVLCCSGGCAEL